MKKETIFSIIMMCIIAVAFVVAGFVFSKDMTYSVTGDETTPGETEEVVDELANVTVIEENGYKVIKERKMIYSYSGVNSNLTVQSVFSGNLTVTKIGKNAFKDNKNLLTVTLPSNIVTIEANAFDGCSNLKSINLEEVTSLGNEAFKNCSSLTSINGTKIEKLSVGAFEGATKLKSITLTNCQTIENRALANCQSLQNISFLNIVNLGDEAFLGCKSLKSFVSESSIRSVGKSAFKDCTFLSLVNFGYLEKIESDTFSGCISLKDVTLERIVSLGDRAFYGCHSLINLSLPEVSSIGSAGLSECVNLKTLQIPKISKIGGSAFNNCISLESINSSDYGVFKLNTLVNISNYYAFNNCKKLQNIILTNIASVGYNSFAGCDNLTTVNMSEYVNIGGLDEQVSFANESYFPTINNIKFHNNDIANPYKTGNNYTDEQPTISVQYIVAGEIVGYDLTEEEVAELVDYKTVTFTFNASRGEILSVSSETEKDIVIPSYINKGQVKTISYGAFDSMKYTLNSVKSVSITSLPASMFSGFYKEEIVEEELVVSGLMDVYFPSVTSIGVQTFEGCKLLKNADLPALTEIPNKAFADCTSLKEIEFFEVTKVGQFAFIDCDGLMIVYLPKTTEIKSFAFSDVKNMVEISCPLLEKIGDYAFYNCNNLSKVNSKYEGECDFSKLENIDGENIFFGNTCIDSVKLNNAKSVKQFAFYGIGKREGEIITTYTIKTIEISYDIANSVENYFENYRRIDGFVYYLGQQITLGGRYGSFTLPSNISEIVDVQQPVVNIVTENGFVFDLASGTITDYVGNLTEVEIPVKIKNIEVTKIGKNAFRDNKTITKITFKSIVEIEDNAFKNCYNLVEIQDRILLSNETSNLQKIGYFAFEGCDNLVTFSEIFGTKLSASKTDEYKIFA